MHLESQKRNFGTNMGVGTLDIAVAGLQDTQQVNDFERELRLDEAVAESRYIKDCHWFRRQSFVSYPHQVLVVNFETDSPAEPRTSIVCFDVPVDQAYIPRIYCSFEHCNERKFIA